MSVATKTLEHLFISKVRLKVLNHFLLTADTNIHLRGLVRELKEEINAVRRELIRLEEFKIVIPEHKGNRKYYTLNRDHYFIPEFMSLFHKSYGLGADIINNKAKLGEVSYAFLTPYYSQGFIYGQNTIDLVIIGKVELMQLEKIIAKYQKEKKRELHYTVLSLSEFQTRRRRLDTFILDLIVQDNIMLIGTVEKMIK